VVGQVAHERIRQIEAKTVRKLRHPSRKLKGVRGWSQRGLIQHRLEKQKTQEAASNRGLFVFFLATAFLTACHRIQTGYRFGSFKNGIQNYFKL
jgi:hypothetical protein